MPSTRKSGVEIFSLKLTWPMFGSPAIAGDLLYQPSEDGKLHTVDLKTQKPSWEFQTEASQQNLAAFLIARRQAKLFRRLHGKLL